MDAYDITILFAEEITLAFQALLKSILKLNSPSGMAELEIHERAIMSSERGTTGKINPVMANSSFPESILKVDSGLDETHDHDQEQE